MIHEDEVIREIINILHHNPAAEAGEVAAGLGITTVAAKGFIAKAKASINCRKKHNSILMLLTQER